jgi:quaternary ammonium compound-resistance protein SugE
MTRLAWFQLLLAGVMEIAMAMALKSSAGWTRFWPSALGVAAALASVFMLTSALKHLPVGLGYAVGTGIGAAGVTVLGIFWLHESASAIRLGLIGLIVVGVIGLRFAES